MARASKTSEIQFRAVVAVAVSLLVLGMVRVRFCGAPELPAKIARPAEPEVVPSDVSKAVAALPRLYDEYLETDSRSFGVNPRATIDSMSEVLERRVDTERRVLVPGSGKSIEVAGLKLTASTQRVEGEVWRILTLSIENTTDTDLAYNITTRPSRGTRVCTRKPHLAHNAMAVRAGATQKRSECIYKRGWKLEVKRVEVVELPPLGYYYVSQVPPGVVGLPPRLAAGHISPAERKCNPILTAAARNGLASGSIEWFDIVDFFVRHRCESYQFPATYRAFRKAGERDLPAIAD